MIWKKIFFLFVGTIEPRKNLSFFLRIFKEILKENKNIEFVVIGDKGWLYDDFFETINKLDIEKHVRILGYVSKEDLPYIFNLAKLFVFPSLYEGFGLPPLESIMCNTASIVSKIPIMEEIFHDNVFYLDLNKSIKELKEELLSIFYDEVKKERMIKKGKELRNKFLWENTAFETLNIYKNLL